MTRASPPSPRFPRLSAHYRSWSNRLALALCVVGFTVLFLADPRGALLLLGGAVLAWVVLFTLVMGAIWLWLRWGPNAARHRLPLEPKAKLSDAGISYGPPDDSFTIPWDELQSLSYYCGEPDYPDPMFGNAPVREWTFSGRGRAHVIDVYFLNVEKVAAWGAAKLPGLDARRVLELDDWEPRDNVILWRTPA